MSANPLQPFSASAIEGIARIIGDTDRGYSGSKIGHLLAECKIPDTDPLSTKWRRIYNALALHQNTTQTGNHIVAFINKTIAPSQHTRTPETYLWFRDELQKALAFSGLGINDGGKVCRAAKPQSFEEAMGRANRMKGELARRSVHPEVLLYCREELLKQDHFHAVLEAVKGVGARMRSMSALGTDGADLVNTMFALGKDERPLFAINPLKTDSHKSEQKGFVNLLVGIFGMIRNPLAHEARERWPMEAEEAMDLLTTLSLAHRKLDKAYQFRRDATP